LKTVVDAGVPALVFFAMAVVGMELTAGCSSTASTFDRLSRGKCCSSLRVPAGHGESRHVPGPRQGGAGGYVDGGIVPGGLGDDAAGTGRSPGSARGANRLSRSFRCATEQLFLLLVLPVLSGMSISRLRPGINQRHGRTLIGLSIVALAGLLGFIIVQEAEQFASALTDIAAATAWLTILTFGAG
jgi:hypothetical protein